MRQHLRFRFNRVDLEGPWCLSKITREDHVALIKFMAATEAKTVAEVFDGHVGKDEDVAAGSPNADAMARARQIYPEESERMASLHVSGKHRVWGLRHDPEFAVIWWDPEHEIWPTKRVYEN